MEIHAVQSNNQWEPTNGHTQYTSDDDDFESGNNTAKLYERSRIKALADEREIVQKKTFTKWVNSHLSKVSCSIEDLYLDLRDGKMLLKLLEILSGERLPRITRGKMRIHCLENVDKSLNFLTEQHVHLENVGAHDIVDGNNRLTLGLIWTIILRFQIQDIMIEEYHTSETRSAKDALLLWCQMKTAGYPNVNIRNFTTSWRDGLAFNAIIHKHRPDLIEYQQLTKAEPIRNLENAFETAESKLGLTRLLDSEDVFVDQPDEKSIITYVVTYYHYFNKVKADNVHSRRIGKVLNQAIETKAMIDQYENLTSDLLEWIRHTIQMLDDRQFANSLSGVQQQLAAFNSYRTVDKPPKFTEKGNLEIQLFTIQSKMRANNQKPYQPPDGKMISDINKAWTELELAEHNREIALRDELVRQEKLEQLAARFDRKAGMREEWLGENQRLVSQDNFGNDLAAVEAATKKHEAIQTDILSYEERVNTVVNVANQLYDENYHDVDRIMARKDNVLRLWAALQELLKGRNIRLNISLKLYHVLQEMVYLLDWIEEIKTRLKSEDYGKHLMGVEDLLQKHDLLDADIRVLGNRMQQVLDQAQYFIDCKFDPEIGEYRPADPAVVKQHGQGLKNAYDELQRLSYRRRRDLEESKQMWQFFWEMADDEQWIKEKDQLMSSPDLGHDLSSVERLIRKHKAMEEELHNRQGVLENQMAAGEDLIKKKNIGAPKISARITEMKNLWERLIDMTTERKQRLMESQEFYQLMTECDDVDSWMVEMVRVVSNDDVGNKLSTTESMLKRHEEVMDQMDKYRELIGQLHEQGDKICEYPDVDSGTVQNRLAVLDKRFKDLGEMAQLRKQRLLDALSMYKLFSVADTVKTWITEKEKLLATLVPGEEIEELEVIRHRFDGFELEMANNAAKVSNVNTLTENLLSREHPSTKEIVSKQDDLNSSWNSLADVVDGHRRKINSAYQYNQYLIECKETKNWIKDKAKLIESTDELGNDLDGIMQLQRKLGGLQRDLRAIEAKVEHLDNQAKDIINEKPDAHDIVMTANREIHVLWNELQDMLKERDARLNESSELQRFLQDLDHFQMWLSRTSSVVASEDHPKDLQEAEKMREEHQQLKLEIDNYQSDFHRLIEFGRRVTDGQTDAQYVFLSQRLNGLEDGWETLHKMWHDRSLFLQQSTLAQAFFRDAVQAELTLSQQENFLSKEELPNSLEAVQNLIKQHKEFMATRNNNDVKINNVLDNGHDLVEQGNFAMEKIQHKCDNIAQRRDANKKRAADRLKFLEEQLILHEYLQEVDDVEEWIAEKMLIATTDENYRDAKNISTRYSKFKAFEDEIAANKDKIEKVLQNGANICHAHPSLAPAMEPKLEELRRQWEELNTTATEKSAKIAEAHREILFDESAKSMMSWMTEVSSQIVTTTEVVTEEIGLVEINEQLKDQKKKDSEMEQKKKMLEDMQTHASKLKEQYPDREQEFEEIQAEVRVKLTQLEAPMASRRDKLHQHKRVRQFHRDVDDEISWVEEKLALVESDKLGGSLLTVQQLLRRHRLLTTEVDNHKPRIESIVQEGECMINENHPQSEKFNEGITKLWALWERLQKALLERQRRLEENELAQQYLFDASEAEAWMGEQELYLMGGERAKDEQGANNAMKKHEQLEKTIEVYADEIRHLGERSRALIEAKHPEADAVAIKQSRVDKMYAGLNDSCADRRLRLEEILKLYHLLREILDLEAWIAERTVVASSHDMGADYEHCCLLRERFSEFAKETNDLGSHRVGGANELCDALIQQGHGESAEIADWKDRINEAWADLLELIETRIQLLKAAWDLHKFYCDCQDVLDRISEKATTIPDELGRDAKSVTSYQRKHAAFEYELQRLAQQVEGVVDTANHLMPSYSGEKEKRICERRDEVLNAWRLLQRTAEERKVHLLDASDFHRFFAMARELCLWMNGMRTEMSTKEKPRDVSGVELLMNSHRSLKAEIDAREENFSICISLGRTLLHRRHPREAEVRERCIQVVTERIQLVDQWSDRWEELQLMLEVYQFARDAAVAESWLMAHEPFLSNHELGESLDETTALLKKHLSFEKAAATQEERFDALRKLTTLEIKERQRTPEQEQARHLEKQRRIEQAVREFQPPPPSPATRPKDQPIQRRDVAPAQSAAPGSPARDTTDTGKAKRPEIPSTLEATMPRKHEWETSSKKASSRSWHELFVMLQGTTIACYKDQRYSREKPEDYYRHEGPIDLIGAYAAPANDYTKRPNVFRLKLSNGGEYLFHTSSEQVMRQWIDAINAVAGTTATGASVARASSMSRTAQQTPSGTGLARSSTLPPGSPEQGGTGGKKKFFTIGRKK